MSKKHTSLVSACITGIPCRGQDVRLYVQLHIETKKKSWLSEEDQKAEGKDESKKKQNKRIELLCTWTWLNRNATELEGAFDVGSDENCCLPKISNTMAKGHAFAMTN